MNSNSRDGARCDNRHRARTGLLRIFRELVTAARSYATRGVTGPYRERTVAVGSFPPNAFGLHDVHGNVWEWVQDCDHDSYAGAPANGSAWESGECARRVARGGAWNVAPKYLRSAYRISESSGYRHNYVGFRVARKVTE